MNRKKSIPADDSKISIKDSSGNVFEDIGFPNPEESLLKAELSHKIRDSIRRKKLTAEQASECLGIDQTKISAIVKGNNGRFSIDRLIRFLRILGNDVDIVVKAKTHTQKIGHLKVITIHP